MYSILFIQIYSLALENQVFARPFDLRRYKKRFKSYFKPSRYSLPDVLIYHWNEQIRTGDDALWIRPHSERAGDRENGRHTRKGGIPARFPLPHAAHQLSTRIPISSLIFLFLFLRAFFSCVTPFTLLFAYYSLQW